MKENFITITFQTTSADHKKLKKIAKKNDRALSAQIRKIIREYIEGEEEGK